MGTSAGDSFDFPPAARLRKRREFLRIQSRGYRVWSQRFIFYIQYGSGLRSRIGITASRKVGNAVKRNKIKRWLREAFRTNTSLFREPFDIVVIAKTGIDDFSYETIESEFTDFAKRYGAGFRPKKTRKPRRRPDA